MSQAVRYSSDPYISIGGNCEGDSPRNCLPRTVIQCFLFVKIKRQNTKNIAKRGVKKQTWHQTKAGRFLLMMKFKAYTLYNDNVFKITFMTVLTNNELPE